MKLKNLKKRVQRLEARIAKDAKKLAKLRLKLTTASKPKAAGTKKKKAKKQKKTVTNKGASPVVAKKKKKRTRLSPEGRAKLRALMNERWAAKRAAAQAGPASDGTGQSKSS